MEKGKQRLLCYREKMQKTRNDCEREVNHRTTYISAGAIGLSLAFMTSSFFTQTQYRSLMHIGLFCEIGALLINYLSFPLTSFFVNRIIARIDKWLKQPEGPAPSTHMLPKTANLILLIYNTINSLILIIGIIFLALFIIRNSA